MLAVAPDLPRAHYLRYLSCMARRELEGSIHALHRYFDYSLRRGGPRGPVAGMAGKLGGGVGAGAGAGAGEKAAGGGKRGGKGGGEMPTIQYASLCLAAVYINFGHPQVREIAAQ